MSIPSEDLALRVRRNVLRMVHAAKASHVGACLSAADLLAVLYSDVLRVDATRPDWPERDRFILSKGHAAAAVYAVLAETNFFPREMLATYCQDGSALVGHVSHAGVPGVDASTGSLGHGLPLGCGLALAAKRDTANFRVFVLLSDGECDEGSTWEGALVAPHHGLDNLVVIVDYNKIQSLGAVKDVLELAPLADKWRAFRWSVREVDGHNHAAASRLLSGVPFESGKPSILLAHTVKGKGVSFMENQLLWHYRNPNDAQLAAALAELGVAP